MDLVSYEASFILDVPVLLPAAGYAAGCLAKRFGTKVFYFAALLGFWIIAGGLYFDRLSLEFLLGAAGRGNHFMWNSGIEVLGLKPWFPGSSPTYSDFASFANLAALGLFLFVYPLSLGMGFYAALRKR